MLSESAASALFLRVLLIYPATSLFLLNVFYRTTNSDGNTVTVTAATEVATNNPNFRSSNGTDNTAAIVGGVVGGVVGIAALVLVLWFCRRRRRRDEFDGNFDPDRVGTGRGKADLFGIPGLGGMGTGAEVTPYSYNPQGQGGAVGPADGMRQVQTGVPGAVGPSSPVLGGPGGAYGLTHSNTQRSHHSIRSDREYGDGGVHYPPPTPSSPTNTSSVGGYSYGSSPYTAVGAAVAHGYANQHLSPGTSIPSSAGSYYGDAPQPQQPIIPMPSPNIPNYNIAPHAGAAPPNIGVGIGMGGAGGGAAALPQFRSAKEREAYFARHRLHEDGTPMDATASYYLPSGPALGLYSPVTPDGTEDAASVSGGGGPSASGPAGSAASADGSHVVVHQDGGRVPDMADVVQPNEIPPTYDSIRRDV